MLRLIFQKWKQMADEPENFVLAHLRRVDEKLDKTSADQREDRARLVSIERAIVDIARERIPFRAEEPEQRAEFHGRFDRISEPLDRSKTGLG
jgi:hypothetical protein